MAADRSRIAIVTLALLALTATAHADVTGKLSLTGTAGRPPLRGKAFLDRTENPYTGGRTLDPMPYLVVVLVGDGASSKLPAPAAPPQVKWKLLGESFERPLLPVYAGTEVVIQNEGKRSPTLVADGAPDLLPNTPLNPRGERAFKAGAAGTLHVLKDTDTPHLTGAVLALPHTYFALPSKDGKYSIPGSGLADGEYTLRVWYRTGWLEGADTKITVKDGKASKDLTLPPGLKVTAAP